MVKDYLREKGVGYETKDLKEDQETRQEYIEKGYKVLPIVKIGGEVIEGYDKVGMDRAIDEIETKKGDVAYE